MSSIPLLETEPELARGLSNGHRERANGLLRVPSVEVDAGDTLPAAGGSTALLVIDGMLLRRVRVAAGRSVELLAKGNVLMPSREDAASFADSEWQVIERARLALLDLSPGSPLTRWPSICAGIAMRAIDRSRAFAIQAATMSIVGVEERVLALLWALAERWGRVTPNGVELELRIHQEVLAEMVGARRPTVSMALSSLADRGLVLSRAPGCWLLRGEPPELEGE